MLLGLQEANEQEGAPFPLPAKAGRVPAARFLMADLLGFCPCSTMLLQLNPMTDEERVRQDDPKTWSFGYQILTAFLERSPHADFKKKTRVIEGLQVDELVGQIIAVEPIGNNCVLVIWQTQEQMAQNPEPSNLRHLSGTRGISLGAGYPVRSE